MAPGAARTAVVVLVTVAAGGCAGAGAGTDAPALAAEVVQSRQDQVAGVVRVGLQNEGATDVAVAAVELVASPFPPATVDRAGRDPLAAGRRVDVRVPYGEPDCDAGTEVADPHVRVTTASGAVTVPVDPGALDRLLAQICGEQRVSEVVELGFGTGWTREGGDLVGTLEMRRVGDAGERPAVALQATAPTVILGLEPLDGPGPPVAALPPDVDQAVVPVRVGSPRCDPHALLESKKTYVFAAWVSLDGGDPLWLPVEAQGEAREAMGALLADVCDLEQ